MSAFLPSNRWETSTSPSPLSASTSWFYEPINHLCAHPGYKLLNIKTIPQIPVEARQFEKFVWKDILKRLHQMLLTDAKIDEQLNWNIQPESIQFGFLTTGRLEAGTIPAARDALSSQHVGTAGG